VEGVLALHQNQVRGLPCLDLIQLHLSLRVSRTVGIDAQIPSGPPSATISWEPYASLLCLGWIRNFLATVMATQAISH
jgi:hypothetical protein